MRAIPDVLDVSERDCPGWCTENGEFAARCPCCHTNYKGWHRVALWLMKMVGNIFDSLRAAPHYCSLLCRLANPNHLWIFLKSFCTRRRHCYTKVWFHSKHDWQFHTALLDSWIIRPGPVQTNSLARTTSEGWHLLWDWQSLPQPVRSRQTPELSHYNWPGGER